MKKVLNIAIFGLGLGILDQLKKQILSALPAHIQVQWVNIAEQDIDLLMVNNAFFDSSSIQKMLSQHGMHYLRLVKSADFSSQIQQDMLAYPVTQLDNLRAWLQEKFFDDKTQAASRPPAVVQQDPIQISSILNACLMPRNGFIQLFDSNGFLALVDTMTERVWLNNDNPMLVFNQSLNQTYATNHLVQEIIKNQPYQDLRNWLWQVSYRSAALDLPEIALQQYFKLHIWPQFESGSGRRDLLKIAACFAQGAQLQMVADQFAISHESLIRFVAISHMMKMGRWIEADEAQLKSQDQSADPGRMRQVLGFFGKLRKKLGL